MDKTTRHVWFEIVRSFSSERKCYDYIIQPIEFNTLVMFHLQMASSISSIRRIINDRP